MRSWRCVARLILSVSRTRKPRLRNTLHRGRCGARLCSKRLAAAGHPQRARAFRRSGAFARSDLGRGNERRRASSCSGHRGHLQQVGTFVAAVWHSRAAARGGVDRSGSGLSTRDISVVGRSCSSGSPYVRAAFGGSPIAVALAGVLPCNVSFDGPANRRLQPTAGAHHYLQSLRSRAVRG